MDNQKYIPISCSYYDELEAIATLRKPVIIEFYRNGEKCIVENVRILNLYTQNKVEFMQLNNQLEIRLDHLITVDGKPLPKGC